MRCKFVIGFAALSLLQHASFVSATTWYVDSTATGADNGTSWTNAWLSPTNITGVSPGDTVYISGGPSGTTQTYHLPTPWNIIGGTTNAFVTYQIGQDAAHDGFAIFDGSGNTTTFNNSLTNCVYFLSLKNGVKLSGDAGDGQDHFVLTNWGAGFQDQDVTHAYVGYVNMGDQLIEGFRSGGAYVKDIELDHIYCKIGVSFADHFLWWNDCLGSWGSCKVHNCTIYVPRGYTTAALGNASGADVFQVNGGGFTVWSNVISSYDMAYTGGQHQDGWQTTGNTWDFKFYDNLVINIGNYGVFGDCVRGGMTNGYIYNNRFVINNEYSGNAPAGIVIGVDRTATQTNLPFANIVIANNLCDGYIHDYLECIGMGNDYTNTINATFTNCIIANNLVVGAGPHSLYIRTNGNYTTTLEDNAFISAADASNYFRAYIFNTTESDYHLTAAATPLLGQGADMSTYFTGDADGLLRGASWDIGPYQHNPGFGLVNPVIYVFPAAESFGSVPVGVAATNTLTVRNIGGGTLNGSASVPAPFSIVSGGSYSLGSNQSQTVAIAYDPSAVGTNVQNVVLSGGAGASCQVNGVAVPVDVGSMTNLTFAAADGTITSPFILAGGYFYQNTQTTNPSLGGSAVYNFTVTKAGNYDVEGFVNAPNAGANSFYVNIDGQPTDPTMIWDIPVSTNGFTEQMVCWRGNGTYADPEYVPKVFTLTAGTHQLVIRGREAYTQISQITIVPAPSQPYIDPPTALHLVSQ